MKMPFPMPGRGGEIPIGETAGAHDEFGSAADARAPIGSAQQAEPKPPAPLPVFFMLSHLEDDGPVRIDGVKVGVCEVMGLEIDEPKLGAFAGALNALDFPLQLLVRQHPPGLEGYARKAAARSSPRVCRKGHGRQQSRSSGCSRTSRNATESWTGAFTGYARRIASTTCAGCWRGRDCRCIPWGDANSGCCCLPRPSAGRRERWTRRSRWRSRSAAATYASAIASPARCTLATGRAPLRRASCRADGRGSSDGPFDTPRCHTRRPGCADAGVAEGALRVCAEPVAAARQDHVAGGGDSARGRYAPER